VDTFTVMTWNVESLFPPDPGASPTERLLYESKLQLITSVVLRTNPDVVALQELGSDDVLAELQIRMCQFTARAISHAPDARGTRVGFLSRSELEIPAQDIVDFPRGHGLGVAQRDGCEVTRMTRGALFIRVHHASREIDLINVHLKSKLLRFDGPDGQRFHTQDANERTRAAAHAHALRTSEAATVRMHANPLLAERRMVVVLGDMNDTPDAGTSQLLEGLPGPEVGSSAFLRGDTAEDMRMFNLAPRIDTRLRYSRIHKSRRELLDQILVSPSFFPREGTLRRRLPVRVWSEVGDGDDLASITDDPCQRRFAVKPDHAPVVATLKL